jgi:hypothetical protein
MIQPALVIVNGPHTKSVSSISDFLRKNKRWFLYNPKKWNDAFYIYSISFFVHQYGIVLQIQLTRRIQWPLTTRASSIWNGQWNFLTQDCNGKNVTAVASLSMQWALSPCQKSVA